ncbi:MAG: DNA mismatch endonuclease Vsr [Planctomycetaceae bacterium]|nr:DNA mismatch endonuclease Vsr [Planctomycetaceae bacterium]
MADVHTRQQRSYNMSRIRGKNTRPEMIVRSLVHRMGFRFRLHAKDLPGKPDLVLPRHRKVILVHGCYWHLHRCRYGRVVPKTNTAFWQEKREGNRKRDRLNRRRLKQQGWEILTVWECHTRNLPRLEETLADFLG